MELSMGKRDTSSFM